MTTGVSAPGAFDAFREPLEPFLLLLLLHLFLSFERARNLASHSQTLSSLLSLSPLLSQIFPLRSYAKVVPTTLDASVVGGRASREADAKIRAAEGGGSFSPSSSPSQDAAAAFPIHAVHTYQYSISEKFTPLDTKAPAVPTVSLSYDMSPLTLSLSRPATPLLHALVRLAAVGGGVKALASFFGALVHAVAGRRRGGGGGGSGMRGSGSGGE